MSKRTLVSWAAFLALVASLFGATPARAEVEVFLQVKPQDPASKTKNDAPMIEATIIGGATVPQDKFVITEPGAKPPVTIKASALRPYTAGTETIAIAFVFNGQEIWIGNDDIEPPDSPSHYPGILKNLKTALQSVPFKDAGPSGSKGVLIVYGEKPEIRVPMGPIENINSESLGTQKDYYKKTGYSMVQGISAAISELHSVTTSRKALIVVSDGNDSNADTVKGELLNLKKLAAQEKIQTFAIIYKGALSDARNDITTMITTATTVDSAEAIANAIKGILSRMSDRYYLTFPGYDAKRKVGFVWDGKPHDLVVKIDKEEAMPSEPLTLAPIWSPPMPGGFPWWGVLLIILGIVLLIVIMVKAFGRKKEVAAPMPMPMPKMHGPEPPKPKRPLKTVMISVGGGDDGFPIVGWLVPMNGQHAFQTFRLRSGGTKIGTAPPADIVVNDGFMSTEHCMINCSPAGFTLVDNNSTNGCYVNDRKISKHDLVDNDTVTLGKTNFKFKSIN
jgi:hypothetical protein